MNAYRRSGCLTYNFYKFGKRARNCYVPIVLSKEDCISIALKIVCLTKRAGSGGEKSHPHIVCRKR